MMTTLLVTQLFALAALIFAVTAFIWRRQTTLQRVAPVDHAPAKGDPMRGILYAFTLGMAPWAKESTRRHPIAYLRGIAFHMGIFAALAAVFTSPWWDIVPAFMRIGLAIISGFGALMGIAGVGMRMAEENLRELSTADDHAAVWAVTIFSAATCFALLSSLWLPVMYVTAGAMMIYAPLSKIRHCVYFFFSRRFFGLFIGRRAVLHTEVAK
jgi:hypothetical protein